MFLMNGTCFGAPYPMHHVQVAFPGLPGIQKENSNPRVFSFGFSLKMHEG